MENQNVAVEPVVETDPLLGAKMDKIGFNNLIHRVVTLTAQVAALEGQLAAVSTKNRSSSEKREMVADDARRVLVGDLRDANNKACQAALNLSYGQVYSCRKEYTFKPIHKEMKEAGLPNLWTK